MNKTPDNTAILRITLPELSPSPWREVEVRLSMNLKKLHDTIQAIFGWYDYHLWEFDVNEKRYGPPQDQEWGEGKVLRAQNLKLERLIKDDVRSFLYVYDFGDHWVHHIEILSTDNVDDTDMRLPRFIKGEYSAPPEDIGGPPGYEYFLKEILPNPNHPERECYEHLINDPFAGAFDSNDIQLDVIRGLLGRVARRKPKPKAA